MTDQKKISVLGKVITIVYQKKNACRLDLFAATSQSHGIKGCAFKNNSFRKNLFPFVNIV